MIAILLASRGLIFAQTVDAISKIREHFYTKTIVSWDKKIPDAQNWLVEEALKTEADEFLFIEEDIVPELEDVIKLVNSEAPIRFVDYGVAGWSCSAKDEHEQVLWCGLGCTLIKRKVFETLKEPWFRTDKALRLNDWKWIDTNPNKVYGGHDIWFCMKAREAGFRIFQSEGECKHLKLDSLGKPEINNGAHIISEKPRIRKQQIIEEVQNIWPQT